jgi:hypothetical protein
VSVLLARLSGRSLVGDLWQFRALVTDLDGDATDAQVPTITVTPPSGAVAHPTVSNVDTGLSQFTYTPLLPGQYTITATTAAYGLAAYAAWADAMLTVAGFPVLADVQDYLDDYSWSDAEINNALAAEAAAQRARLRPSAVFGSDLREALLRRVQRNLAMRRLPLATPQGDAEGGAAFIPRTDPEIRRLEAPHRKLSVG